MKTTTPPKDFDLTANLFSAPGYVPSKGSTSQLRGIREGCAAGELTAKLQQQGLITIRAMMLEAQFSRQKRVADFARKYGAMMLLGGAWHSFAGVTRLVARLPSALTVPPGGGYSVTSYALGHTGGLVHALIRICSCPHIRGRLHCKIPTRAGGQPQEVILTTYYLQLNLPTRNCGEQLVCNR